MHGLAFNVNVALVEWLILAIIIFFMDLLCTFYIMLNSIVYFYSDIVRFIRFSLPRISPTASSYGNMSDEF